MTRLRDEIRQTKPFKSAAEEAFLSVLRTADELSRRSAEALKPFGISSTQYNVLRILRGAGPRGLPCREIGTRMITHDPDVTRLLDRLEANGLIQRTRGEQDRRVITTRISEAGLRLLQDLDGIVDECLRSVTGSLAEPQLKTLTKLLERMRQGAGAQTASSVTTRQVPTKRR